MGCCFGKVLKYRRIRLAPQKCIADGIYGHSAESHILASCRRKKDEFGIPKTIDDEVAKLFAIEHSSESESDDAVVPNIEKDNDLELACEPLSMHLKDVDDDDEIEERLTTKQFLEDSDLEDDVESEDSLAEVLNLRTKRPDDARITIEIGSEFDEIDVDALIEANGKKPMTFLDSDDDLEFVNTEEVFVCSPAHWHKLLKHGE
jgi:hypothetical protein